MLQYTPYTIPLVLVIVLGVAGGWLTWYRGDSDAERWFTAIELSVALWALAHLAILSATSFEAKLLLVTVGLPTASILPVTLVGFTLHYVGRGDWLTRRRLAVLVALPVLTMGISLTTYLVRHSFVDPQLVTTGSYVEITYRLGWLPRTAAVISWAMVLGCIVLLARKFSRSRNVYRKLSFVLLVTFVVMLGANVASFTGFSPFPHLLALPFSFLFFGAVALVTTTSVRVLRLLPLDRTLARISARFDDVVTVARDYVLEEIDAGVVVLDADWRVVDINATAKEIVSHDRPVGRNIREVIDLSSVVESGDLVEAIESCRRIRSLTDQLWVETDEGERCYDVAISTLEGRGGAVAGRVVLINDVTDQKRRERELRQREGELREQKRDLQRQTTQLEHQNERLDRFAGIVSHDLRNPLSVAEGNAELLGESLSAEERERVDKISDALGRMEDIIDDALTLARQGKAVTDVEPVDLEAVARAAWDNVDTQAATLRVDGNLAFDADRNRLLTLFENLFRNAVEHGGSDVTVRVGALDDDERGFYVADDGPGIPDDRKGQVLDHGFTTTAEGTGLGLSIVTDVARGHGWIVDVADSAAGGTRFEIRGLDARGPEIGPEPSPGRRHPAGEATDDAEGF